MKQSNIEKRFLEYVEENLDVLFITIITLIGLIIRFSFIDIESGDYYYFIGPWMEHIKSNGGILALKDVFANYNQPYLVLLSLVSYLPIKSLHAVKILQIICDIFLAITACLFIKELTKKSKDNRLLTIITYTIVFMLPTVILNGSFWAQCDSIYTSFALLALLMLIKERYHKSFIFWGIALAFKLQAIFFLPLYLILYFKEKKFSITNFLYLPIVNILLCLPSILVGHPILDIITIYFKQAGYYSSLTMNMYNFYSFFSFESEYIKTIGYGITIIYFGILLYLIMKNNKVKFNNDSIITLGLLSILICVFFLPTMHDRYLFMADVLSIIWYLKHKDKIIIPIGINLISFICYIPFLFGYTSEYFKFISIIYFFIIIILTRYFVGEIKMVKKNYQKRVKSV